MFDGQSGKARATAPSDCDGELAWVGQQWRMEGYCGRAPLRSAPGAGPQMIAGSAQTSIAAQRDRSAARRRHPDRAAVEVPQGAEAHERVQAGDDRVAAAVGA